MTVVNQESVHAILVGRREKSVLAAMTEHHDSVGCLQCSLYCLLPRGDCPA